MQSIIEIHVEAKASTKAMCSWHMHNSQQVADLRYRSRFMLK